MVEQVRFALRVLAENIDFFVVVEERFEDEGRGAPPPSVGIVGRGGGVLAVFPEVCPPIGSPTTSCLVVRIPSVDFTGGGLVSGGGGGGQWVRRWWLPSR